MKKAARKPFLFRTRWCVAASGFGTAFLVAFFGPNNPQQLGQDMLNWVAIVAFAFCLFSGLFLTADCISQEKREGTLGLLFLTDLRGYDVVLGKMTAQAAWSFVALLSLLPVMLLPLFTGGVPWTATVRTFLVLILTLLFSLSCGLAVSSMVTETKSAFLGTFLLLIGITVLPMWVMLETGVWKSGTASLNPLYHISPAFGLFVVLNFHNVTGAQNAFILSVSVLAILCICCLAISAAKTRLFREPPAAPFKAVGRFQSLWERFAPQRASQNWPVCEKIKQITMQETGLGMPLKTAFGTLFLLWLFTFILSVTDQIQVFHISLCLAFVIHLFFKFLWVLNGVSLLSRMVKSGEWEMFLTTPLEEREIFQGFSLGYRRMFLPGLCWLAGINGLMLVCLFISPQNFQFIPGGQMLIGIFLIGGLVTAFADARAIQQAALWQGRQGKPPMKAAMTVMARIFVVPWILAPLFTVFSFSMNNLYTGLLLHGIAWFAISLIVSLSCCGQARIEWMRLRHA